MKSTKKAETVRGWFAAVGAASMLLAGSPSLAQELKINPERGRLMVGAGAMTYIAQESPSTGMALDARYEYPIMSGLAVEGSAATAFSESVGEKGSTIPLILESGLKLRSLPSGRMSVFGVAGLGYGAYLGTEELQDGATFTMPLSLGVEWEGRQFGLSPRFTYRPVFGDQLGDEAESDADSWAAVIDFQLPLL